MAVPKRRHSKSRKRKRRTHDGCAEPNIPHSQKHRPEGQRSKRFFCGECNQVKPPHSVCPNCGHYRGRAMIEVER